MVNRGVVPIQPLTEVGQFRARSGDVTYTELDPPEAGFGSYTYWSDVEIEAFLAATSTPEWAIYQAYLQLASSAALESKSIKDMDLAVDTTKRAEALRQIALMWRGLAEDADDLSGGNDYFDIVPMGDSCDVIPELTVPEYGRRYTWGRVC